MVNVISWPREEKKKRWTFFDVINLPNQKLKKKNNNERVGQYITLSE